MNCASSPVSNSVRLGMGATVAIFTLLLLSSALLAAQQLPSSIERPTDAAKVFAIWPGTGIPPGTENWTWHEQSAQVAGTKVSNRMVRNVVIPTVTLYKPAPERANGTALIVAPGGAFRFLMFDLEGADLAHALTPLGVTVFVLRYRVAHTPEGEAAYAAYLNETWKIVPHPDRSEINPPVGNVEAEQARDWADADALQAIQFVRTHANDLGIDPKRIGIAGFSAGGIGVDAAMHHTADSRPDFVAGIYPGYRPGIRVPEDAPPLFIAATDDDILVSPISGARLYEAWHAAGKPAELHIFDKGQHGFAMKKQGLPSDAWVDLFTTWLNSLGLLNPANQHDGRESPDGKGVQNMMKPSILRSAATPEDIQAVSPALASYTENSIAEDLWKRPGLSPRDRSLVTVSALIARNQTIGMLHYFNIALDSGVTASELSEIVTHLAFYCGWPNALSAIPALKEIFGERGIGADQLPVVSPQLLPLNEAAEAQRASTVEKNFGTVAPGVVQYTTDLLFRDLWLRPALAPRDRSLVTVSALIASGQVAQVTYHLNRAMDNGLTQAQASEALTHLAFYAGWPNVFSALPVVKDIFEKRPK